MNSLNMVIKTLTHVGPGSGEGYGSGVGRDVVFDDLGLPYLPARRIKGVLREAAIELQEMFTSAGIMTVTNDQIEKLFGREGQQEGSGLIVTDFYFPDYKHIQKWFKYLFDQYGMLFAPPVLMDYFTETRHQTSINDQGVAEEGSLRTSRVLRKDLSFEGKLFLNDDSEEDTRLIALACANMRRLGGQRNRGFGEVEAVLYSGNMDLTRAALDNLQVEGAK